MNKATDRRAVLIVGAAVLLAVVHARPSRVPAADSLSPVVSSLQIEADWLRQDELREKPLSTAEGPLLFPIAKAVERGRKLAGSLHKLGAKVSAEENVLLNAIERLKRFSAATPPDVQRKLYFDVRWAVRGMALKNPLLDFDAVLFVKHAPGQLPHMSDQFYGWWSRPGGGVYLVEGFKGKTPTLRCLTEGFSAGSFMRPELSYDGKKMLFAYC